MSSVDLGKQVGPLPLGAWVAVVGAGLGIAVYTRRQSAGSSEPVVVEDTSGVPGVGTGVNGMWTDVTPQPPSNVPTVYADNDAWGRAAIDRLVVDGYPAAQVYSAITKALAGGTGDNQLSVSEFAIWARALVLLKAPPTPVGVPAPSVPGTGGGGGTPTPSGRYKMDWVRSPVGASAGGTIKYAQKLAADDAYGKGAWRPSGASLNAITLLAASKSHVALTTKLKRGQMIYTYRAVPA